MASNKQPNSQKTAAHRSLISSSSILILSGLLIGIVATELVPAGFQLSACLGGAVGVIAYFSLQTMASRFEQRETDRRLEHQAIRLHGLVDRHIPRLRTARSRRPLQRAGEATDRQYVTVTRSERNHYRENR